MLLRGLPVHVKCDVTNRLLVWVEAGHNGAGHYEEGTAGGGGLPTTGDGRHENCFATRVGAGSKTGFQRLDNGIGVFLAMGEEVIEEACQCSWSGVDVGVCAEGSNGRNGGDDSGGQ